MSFHCDSLVLVLFGLCVCFLCCFLFFWLWFCCLLRVFGCCVFLFSPWNHIISVHHEPEAYYSIGFYCRIHTASKYLHNDLARAIKALEQKKIAFLFSCFVFFDETAFLVSTKLLFNSSRALGCVFVLLSLCFCFVFALLFWLWFLVVFVSRPAHVNRTDEWTT